VRLLRTAQETKRRSRYSGERVRVVPTGSLPVAMPSRELTLAGRPVGCDLSVARRARIIVVG
jgi:hypothetical protein